MNIIIYENDTKNIVYAGQLKSDIRYLSDVMNIDHMTINNFKFNNMSYDLTDDTLDFIIDPVDNEDDIPRIRSYTKKYNELNINSKKGYYISQIVKQLAFDKINAIAPAWIQRNYLAKSIVLLDKEKSTWTQDDIDNHDRLTAIWDRIKHYQNASNLIEQEVLNDPLYDIYNSPLWTE